MNMLTRADLWSLEQYAEARDQFRADVLAHKKNRNLPVGEHLQLIFEDSLTVRYQIQEMLRIEKVFEASGIQEELDAYNPLIPDGDNWKCTLLIQYEDVEERRIRLTELLGIEEKIWIKIGDCEPLYPIADEDMDRADGEKTSAVHFLRFQLTPAQQVAARDNQELVVGVSHPAYPVAPEKIPEAIRLSLVTDIVNND